MKPLRRTELLILMMMLMPIFQSCAGMKTWIPKGPVKTSAPAPVEDSLRTSGQAANPAKESPVKRPLPGKESSRTSGQAANPSKESPIKASAPGKDSSQASIKASSQAAESAKKYMEAGEYQNAVEAYHVEYRKNPHDQALVKEYVKCIEEITSAADKALDEKDFASAGRNYDVLLKNYAHFKELEKKLSFDITHLSQKLGDCKKAMFTQAIQEYRKGNLSGAIALWQDLLAIDPHDTDTKEALRTAKLQQKNLKEDKP
jgi:tetratricopeptide (TPR) repeat protein